MAVDFDWVSGSAPRYVDAYRRALKIKPDFTAAERNLRRAESPTAVAPSNKTSTNPEPGR